MMPYWETKSGYDAACIKGMKEKLALAFLLLCLYIIVGALVVISYNANKVFSVSLVACVAYFSYFSYKHLDDTEI